MAKLLVFSKFIEKKSRNYVNFRKEEQFSFTNKCTDSQVRMTFDFEVHKSTKAVLNKS